MSPPEAIFPVPKFTESWSENPSTQMCFRPEMLDQRVAIAQAKAKYKYPWWAATEPVEIFWGQVNESLEMVSLGKFQECACMAMRRTVLPNELLDKESLRLEFCARVGAKVIDQLNAKLLKN
jgi:hypothetical protein